MGNRMSAERACYCMKIQEKYNVFLRKRKGLFASGADSPCGSVTEKSVFGEMDSKAANLLCQVGETEIPFFVIFERSLVKKRSRVFPDGK